MKPAENIPETKSEKIPFSICERPIIVVEYDDFALRKYRLRLTKAGFTHVTACRDFDGATKHLEESRCDLMFLGIDLIDDKEKGFHFLNTARARAYRGIIAVTCAEPTPEDFFCAAVSGANDFLVKGRNLDVVSEAVHLLGHSQWVDLTIWRPDAVLQTGFFRSLGMTGAEMEVLSEFARDFPRQMELAERLGKNVAQINKVFSRIYEKLNDTLGINNPAKLSHLLTICCLYR